MSQKGFGLLDLIVGLGIFGIAVLVSLAVLERNERSNNKYWNALTSAQSTGVTAQALWNSLAASDLRTYAFSSATATSTAYRLFVPLRDRDSALLPQTGNVAWIAAANSSFRTQSLSALCSVQREGRWLVYIPLWDRGEGAASVHANSVVSATTLSGKSNSTEPGAIWGLQKENATYLFKLVRSFHPVLYSQSSVSGEITLVEGADTALSEFPTLCFGEGKLVSNEKTPAGVPIYSELTSLEHRWLVLEISPLVLGSLIQDSSVAGMISAHERVLNQFEGRLAETPILSMGIDADRSFNVRKCRTGGSGDLGLSCGIPVSHHKDVDGIYVKLRTQINAYATSTEDEQPFREFLITLTGNLPTALERECPTVSCTTLPVSPQFAHQLEYEKTSRYLASAFSTIKLESLQQSFIYIVKGDRIAHRFQQEYTR